MSKYSDFSLEERTAEQMGIMRKEVVYCSSTGTLQLKNKLADNMNPIFLVDDSRFEYWLDGDAVTYWSYKWGVIAVKEQGNHISQVSLNYITAIDNDNDDYSTITFSSEVTSGTYYEVIYYALCEMRVDTDILFNNDETQANASIPLHSSIALALRALKTKTPLNLFRSGYTLFEQFIMRSLGVANFGLGALNKTTLFTMGASYDYKADYDDRFPVILTTVHIVSETNDFAVKISRHEPAQTDIRDKASEDQGITSGWIDMRYSTAALKWYDGADIYYMCIPLGNVSTKELTVEVYKNQSGSFGNMKLWISAYAKGV